MKNRIILIAIILLATLACSANLRDQVAYVSATDLPTATPTTVPTETPFVVDANEEPVVYPVATVVGNWNLREGNGTEWAIVGYVYNGTRVQVIYRYYGWAWVIANGRRGWIYEGALR